tara:strand:+ start:3389 stop:4441 length:1053 start_codon:yes stop_codon:yes gene_type:complete
MWHEMPRIRHQLARLLCKNQHDVFFVQKPCFFWERPKCAFKKEGIKFFQFKQLIHHQLRIASILRCFNSLYEIIQIRNCFSNIDKDTVIINFNYDYYFLKKIFPSNKIITILNDDFVSQCRLPFNHHMQHALENTCLSSDIVLTTSESLKKKLKKHTTSRLFFPWSSSTYNFIKDKLRTKVLVWGYITERYDFDLISNLIGENQHIIFYIVGETNKNCRKILHHLTIKHKNIVIKGPTNLFDLPMSEFCASLTAFKKGVDEIESITITNKAFQLLSYGIPLVVHGMPNFIKNPAIFVCNDQKMINKSIQYCHQNIEQLQRYIFPLVIKNSENNRLTEFMKIINKPNIKAL